MDDGTVYRLEDRVWVMTNGSGHADHFAEATRVWTTQIEAVTLDMPHLGSAGSSLERGARPALRQRHRGVSGTSGSCPSRPRRSAGSPVSSRAQGSAESSGYELFCRPEHAADLWDVAVSKMNARPFGVGVLESLRVEAGLVVFDYDYAAHERTPYDLVVRPVGCAREGAKFLGCEALRSRCLRSTPPAQDPPNGGGRASRVRRRGDAKRRTRRALSRVLRRARGSVRSPSRSSTPALQATESGSK